MILGLTTGTYLNSVPLVIASASGTTITATCSTYVTCTYPTNVSTTTDKATTNIGGTYDEGELMRFSNFNISNNYDCGYYSQDANHDMTFTQGSFDYNTNMALCGTGIFATLTDVHLEQINPPFINYTSGTRFRMEHGSIYLDAPVANISSFYISNNVVYFTVDSISSFYSGENFSVSGLTTGTYLNGASLTISTASGSTITAAFTHTDVGTTTENAGKLYGVFNGLFSLPVTPSGSSATFSVDIKDVYALFNTPSGISAQVKYWLYTNSAYITAPNSNICIGTVFLGNHTGTINYTDATAIGCSAGDMISVVNGTYALNNRYYSYGPTPTVSSGTLDTANFISDDQHGAITGLSSATSVTLTFGTYHGVNGVSAGAWPYKPSCVATTDGATYSISSTPVLNVPYVSAVSTTAVTFSFTQTFLSLIHI